MTATCTCSFLATLEGQHRDGCALQCPVTLDRHPLGIAVAFATVNFARCQLGAGHDGPHAATIRPVTWPDEARESTQTDVTWRTYVTGMG